jgi:hypothetical protein
MLIVGCSQPAETPVGTGAEEAAQGYGEALLMRNWRQAYAALHPDSRHAVMNSTSRDWPTDTTIISDST